MLEVFRMMVLLFKLCSLMNAVDSRLDKIRMGKSLHNSSSVSPYDNPSEYHKDDDNDTDYKYFEFFNIERVGEKTSDHCKQEACVASQQSSLQFEYKCKNHEYYMNRIKSRYLFKLKTDERLDKKVFNGCDSVDECKSLKSLELQKYKMYVLNQQNILRREYKKEAANPPQ